MTHTFRQHPMDSKHPLDIDIYDFGIHLRGCSTCRLHLARIMYKEPVPEFDPWDDRVAPIGRSET